MEPLLTTHGLSIGYGNKIVAEGIELSIGYGELVGLLGANGRGKSTLLRTLSGAQRALSGEIEVEGRPLAEWSGRRLARMMSLVYTDRTLAGGLTVKELVSLGRQPYTGFFGRLDGYDREVVDRSMELAGIERHCDSYVANLSDGERQKVMIAKALAQQTPIILMDEPTAFLDVESRLKVMELLKRLTTEEGRTILLSTHDIAPVVTTAHRLILFLPTTYGVGKSRVVTGNVAELERDAENGLQSLFPSVTYDTTAHDYR